MISMVAVSSRSRHELSAGLGRSPPRQVDIAHTPELTWLIDLVPPPPFGPTPLHLASPSDQHPTPHLPAPRPDLPSVSPQILNVDYLPIGWEAMGSAAAALAGPPSGELPLE